MHKPMNMESGLSPPPYQTAPPQYGAAPPQYGTDPSQYPTASPQPLAPPHSKPSSSLVVDLVLRILTFLFLLTGLVLLATNSVILATNTVLILAVGTLHSGDVVSYRYLFSVIAIGFVYNLTQIGFAIVQMITGAQRGKVMLIFDFYGDKCLSLLLGTGAAAGFGASIDLNRFNNLGDFPNKGNAASSMVFMAFLFTLASSIASSYGLPKISFFN